MASGAQSVMTTGNYEADRSSVGVWDTMVFKLYIKELTLDKVIKNI